MPAQSSSRRSATKRRRAIVIIGESEYDTTTIGQLFRALRPDFTGAVRARKDPPLLIKNATPGNLPNRANILAALVRSEELTADVVCALAHEDCDATEPAHIALSNKIESLFKERGINAYAVTPAWEMETWLFLWPEASKQYRPKWRRPDSYNGTNVGMLSDAKEKFKRAVRPSTPAARAGVRDYRESDAPMIAAKVLELGIIDRLSAMSNSYTRFCDALRSCNLTESVVDQPDSSGR